MTDLIESSQYHRELTEIQELQRGIHRNFWISSPFFAGLYIELVQTLPGVLYKVLEDKQVTGAELLPMGVLFLAWHYFYWKAEESLINMERKNFNLALNSDESKLPVRYGFPERCIARINWAGIKLRNVSCIPSRS